MSIDDAEQVSALLQAVRPNEIYYLAAHHNSSEQSEVDNSPSEYEIYHRTHVVGLLNFLWAIRRHSPDSRLFYAASSLVFSGIHGPIQNEDTQFTPHGYYGLTKAQGIMVCREFRRSHGVFAAAGILYNHESALRSDKFLSKKIIASAHRISLGLEEELILGNLAAETDWGYAPEYIEAFQRILRTNTPDDFVVATGESHSVAEFAQIAFSCFGLDFQKYVVENQRMLNRIVPRKVGDNSKLKIATGWTPTLNFENMVRKLVNDYLECGSYNLVAQGSVREKSH
jgi:GDPmannose 4,6-dehydratase